MSDTTPNAEEFWDSYLAGVLPAAQAVRIDPPVPSDAAWARVLENIRKGIADARPAESPRRRPTRFALFAALGVLAAGLLLTAVLLPFGAEPAAEKKSTILAEAESLEFAGPADVDILSVAAGDEELFVVGEAPQVGPIEWAGERDVKVHGDGPPPWSGGAGGGLVMLIAP